jgi:hypothetical protein
MYLGTCGSFEVRKSLKRLGPQIANPQSAQICGRSVYLTNYLNPQTCGFADRPCTFGVVHKLPITHLSKPWNFNSLGQMRYILKYLQPQV